MSLAHIFGPVVSGRLGRSLGLDLLGAKICTMDCLYCEVGPTRQTVTARKAYVPARNILHELAAWRRDNPDLPLDHVTLGGSGEPCLNTDMAAIVAGCKELFPGVPVAVLTNTSLLDDADVAADLASADVVLPSLDSLVPEEHQAVNRPHAGISAKTVAQALLRFRAAFAGRLYLEVLLCREVNDSEENLVLLMDYVAKLRPDRVDVVTLSRPGAHPCQAVDAVTLTRWREALCARPGPERVLHTGQAHEPVGPRRATRLLADPERLEAAILASVRRRPQTAAQLADALGFRETDLASLLASLEKREHIQRDICGGQVFFRPAANVK